MEISRRRIVFFAALVVAVSAIVLFFTVDMETFRRLADFHPASLLGVILLIAAGMYFDALRLQRPLADGMLQIVAEGVREDAA